MRNSTLMMIAGMLAALLWAALVVFMNGRPPTSLNQGVFLLLWALTVWLTVAPLAYLLNARLAPSLGRARDLSRAMRQGLFVGILAAALMGMRFMRTLNLLTAVLLLLVLAMVETLFYLRTR
jgi:hypothetical protein